MILNILLEQYMLSSPKSETQILVRTFNVQCFGYSWLNDVPAPDSASLEAAAACSMLSSPASSDTSDATTATAAAIQFSLPHA